MTQTLSAAEIRMACRKINHPALQVSVQCSSINRNFVRSRIPAIEYRKAIETNIVTNPPVSLLNNKLRAGLGLWSQTCI
ncbi:hypothetical protein D3C80_1548860 [compost metagenome]